MRGARIEIATPIRAYRCCGQSRPARGTRIEMMNGPPAWSLTMVASRKGCFYFEEML